MSFFFIVLDSLKFTLLILLRSHSNRLSTSSHLVVPLLPNFRPRPSTFSRRLYKHWKSPFQLALPLQVLFLISSLLTSSVQVSVTFVTPTRGSVSLFDLPHCLKTGDSSTLCPKDLSTQFGTSPFFTFRKYRLLRKLSGLYRRQVGSLRPLSVLRINPLLPFFILTVFESLVILRPLHRCFNFIHKVGRTCRYSSVKVIRRSRKCPFPRNSTFILDQGSIP